MTHHYEIFILHDRPECVTLRGAFATPTHFRWPPPGEKFGFISGCLYDSSLRRVPLSERSGGNFGDLLPNRNPHELPREAIQDAPTLHGHSLYLGHLMHHYGHFLVETLPNLGWIRHIPAFDWLVFHRFHESKSSHPNLLKVLRFLNVPPEKVKIVEGPLSFEQITIPERLFAFHKSAHIRAKEMHSSLSQAWGAGNAAGNSPDPGWYYLSRVNTALTSGGAAVANEVFLEETLMRCGVDVVYPEQLDFETQVRLFSSAQVVIGPGGSAMHNILFSPPGGVLIELADTRSIGQFYPTQAICNRLAGWTGVFAPFMGQILSAQEGRGICWFKVGPLRKFILDTIAAHGLAGSAPKRGKRLGHTSRRDGLLLSAKCLLKTALRRATAGRSGLLRRGTFVR